MDWRFNTVWFDQLPAGEVRSVDFCGRSADVEALRGGRYILAYGYKPRSGCFESFPADGAVTYADLSLSTISSFRGAAVLGPVKRLEIHRCVKLEHDVGLAEVAGSLEWLHINLSKKFRIGDELPRLSALRVLRLNSCGALPDLEFLGRLPRLLDFRFVNTNVLSGDLSPILNHPTLRLAAFTDKRRFNMRKEEVNERLAARGPAERTVVSRGRFSTFRYTSMRA